LENLPLSKRFHLVHATHLSDDELKKLAASGANVVLCPSTEGNLGDGIFRMKIREIRWALVYRYGQSYWTQSTGGLRMLDYRQRLITNHRNTFDGMRSLFNWEEIESGRKAMGLKFENHFGVGQPLDAVVYDAGSPLLGNTSLRSFLGTLVYSTDSSVNLGTLVNGKWMIKTNSIFRE